MQNIPTTLEAYLAKRPMAKVVRVPGRVNIIGEHTDYNQGWTMPAAVDRYMWIVFEPSDTMDWRIRTTQYDEVAVLPIQDPIIRMDCWSRFPAAVLHGLAAQGLAVCGYDFFIESEIPPGAGMSSSTALICGLLAALNHEMAWGLSIADLIHLASTCEYRTGVQGGLMDQYTIFHGREGQLLKLDCKVMESSPVSIPGTSYRWVLYHSGVAHELAHSPYNARRAACRRIVQLAEQSGFSVLSLRDMDFDILQQLQDGADPDDFQKALFVLRENDRVHRMEDALTKGDMDSAGQVLYEGHCGLRDAYQVSCVELDFLVDTLETFEGVAGARMMGGGFGGCVIALIRNETVTEVTHKLTALYNSRFDITIQAIPVAFANGITILQ